MNTKYGYLSIWTYARIPDNMEKKKMEGKTAFERVERKVLVDWSTVARFIENTATFSVVEFTPIRTF